MADTGKKRGRLSATDNALFVLCFVAALTVYLMGLLPGNGFHIDTLKFQMVGKLLAYSHPPGHPLYILTTWVVAQVPFGELAWRINFFSALCGALSAGVLYLAVRLIGGCRLPALASAMALAFSRLFWAQSLVAEVYTPYFLLLTSSILFLVLFQQSGKLRHYTVAATCFGLSFGIHPFSAFFIPGFFILLTRDRVALLRSRSGWIASLGGAFLGAVPFAYYIVRPLKPPAVTLLNPMDWEFILRSPADFINFITGGRFRTVMFYFSPEQLLGERVDWLLKRLAQNFDAILLIAAVLGLLVLVFRDWRFGLFFAVPTVASCFYAMNYGVFDAEVFLLPAVLGLSVGLGIAVSETGHLAEKISGKEVVKPVVITALVLAAATLQAPSFIRNSLQLDLSREYIDDAYADKAMETVEPGSLIINRSEWNYFTIGYRLWTRGDRAGEGIELITHRYRSCNEVLATLTDNLGRRPLFAASDCDYCLVNRGLTFSTYDWSLRLPDYLEHLPDGRLLLVVIRGEGLDGIGDSAWNRLAALGITEELRGRSGWSYVAVLVKQEGRMVGRQKADEGAVALDVQKGEELAPGITVPFDLKLRSGGFLSGSRATLICGGSDFSMNRQGMQLYVFDSASGVPIGRQTFDTHHTTSRRDQLFFRIAPLQPVLRKPFGRRIDLTNYLKRGNHFMAFDLQVAEQRPMKFTLFFKAQNAPTIKFSEIMPPDEYGNRPVVTTETKAKPINQAPPELLSWVKRHERKRGLFYWQIGEGPTPRRISVRPTGRFTKVDGLLHYQ